MSSACFVTVLRVQYQALFGWALSCQQLGGESASYTSLDLVGFCHSMSIDGMTDETMRMAIKQITAATNSGKFPSLKHDPTRNALRAVLNEIRITSGQLPSTA